MGSRNREEGYTRARMRRNSHPSGLRARALPPDASFPGLLPAPAHWVPALSTWPWPGAAARDPQPSTWPTQEPSEMVRRVCGQGWGGSPETLGCDGWGDSSGTQR